MPSILIVEDNASFRQMLFDLLSDRFPDIEILEAHEGRDALRLVEQFEPFLVFMDIRLPGEHGLELTRKIKLSHPETAVTILTSYDLPEYREAAQRSGASHFIVKSSSSIKEIFWVVRLLLPKGNGDGDSS
jgi:DNA-binding NarL/FixJ family response regulator